MGVGAPLGAAGGGNKASYDRDAFDGASSVAKEACARSEPKGCAVPRHSSGEPQKCGTPQRMSERLATEALYMDLAAAAF